MNNKLINPSKQLEAWILTIRGQWVILDSDLAWLYDVETKWLNEQVRRNFERFPPDFMFQLTEQEMQKIELIEAGKGKRRKDLPYAFSEIGAIMAASVLDSKLAVAISIRVSAIFAQFREMLTGNKDLAELQVKGGGQDETIRTGDMDFYEYREIFYFLQYQFYIRSDRHENEVPMILRAIKSNTAELPALFDFLVKLLERPEDVHLKWEIESHPKTLPKGPEIKRVPRGMKKSEINGMLPVVPKHSPGIYSPDLPELPENAHNYMLFEIPEGHRVNQIASIYKSLLVYDAVSDGCKLMDIANNVLSRKFASLTPFRKLSYYEWIGCHRYSAEEKLLRYCPPVFSATVRQDDKRDQQLFNTKNDIERYYERAKTLIHLAESGQFKQYPAHLKNN